MDLSLLSLERSDLGRIITTTRFSKGAARLFFYLTSP